MQEELSKIKAEMPSLSISQRMQELGARWKSLEAEHKQKYTDKHLEEQKAYQQAIGNYRSKFKI